MESSTPIPNTIVPIIAVKIFTPKSALHIRIGCQRTTAATAVMVNIAILGERNSIAIANSSMNMVAMVESLWAVWIPSLMSIDIGSPPVSLELATPSSEIVIE